MATLDPHEDFQETLAAVTSGLKESFPIRGRKTSLHLVGVHAGEMPDPEDIASQYAARVAGKSWMVPVQGTLELRDNETDKVLLTQKTKLMSIPAMTKRFSFIYNGQEHQSANQWQLKPGVFARRQENGELEARFNVVNRAAFKMKLDPESQLFHVEYKKSNLPAYPLLRAMGVSDDDMKAAWGDQVFQANKQVKRQAGVLSQFYRTSTNGKAPPEDEVALQDHLRQVMKESKVRPEVVERTLGHKVDHVDAKLMLNAGSKLIAVQNGAPEDDRDSLEFKTLRSTGDFIKDQIQTASRNLGMKVQRQLNKGDLADIRHAFRPGMFDEAVRKLFQSSLVNPAKQINPVDMVGTAMQTTIMGPGGIKSDIQVTEAAKQINPSQFGMIDPLTTPEGGATGISLRLPIGVKRIGDQPHIPVYSLKEKKTVYVSPEQMMRSKKVFPDEVEFKNGVPHPLNKKVKALGHGNEPEIIDFHEADYVLKDPSQVYGTTVNLVPFLQNNSGGRVSMASRHIEQSISLRDRDKPLVRVMAPGHSHTFEEMIGQQSAHVSPVDGKVTKVTPDGIHVKDASGKEHLVHIYNNYPVNDAKSVLHSTPLVKPGDSVKKGGVLADNNYTRDGVLALGKNLRTAFMSYHGLNFEDGIVVTESAAKKLTSNHLHKEMLAIPEINNQLIFDTKKFQAAHPLAFTKDQLTHIGADGVAKVGSKIKPGDPLVLAMQPYQIKDRTGIGAIRKSLTNQLVDKSLRWESDVPGEIVSVHRNDQGIHVHVRTEEPVRVGDKLSHRHGGKGIITAIIPDKEAPHSKDGKPVDLLFQPGGLGGRMNIGQVLEAMTGKIAEKTGKPYFVKNFDPKVKDWTRHVMGEMKAHGLSDTEELFDPKTGLSYGQVMTGPIHFLKLVHQMDKKESMRSGMSLPRTANHEKYDPTTLQPASGGGTGGQSWGQLGIYALLAHGAKGILRESMTFKSEGEDAETNESKRWRSQHNEVWGAIQTGQPLPPPKPTFSFHRFTELIKGAGINVEKKGDEFVLSPLTNSHILKMSKGEVSDPTAVVHSRRDENGVFKPIKGGLFDEKITGGHGGTGWSHIKLPEPMPNPVFEEPIKKVLGITEPTYQALVEGSMGVNPLTGKVGKYEKGFLVGGTAFKKLLGAIDVNKELAKTRKELDVARPSAVNNLYKKARYLQGLSKAGMKADDAYVLDYLPVVPPKLRPLSNLDDGALHYEGINGIYNQLGQLTNAMNSPAQKMLPESHRAESRKSLYEHVASLFGTAALPEGAKDKGILHMISGTQPKRGLAQKGLLSRRQDASARATIIPEPKLSLDEVGLPKEMAMTIFRPQLVRQLVVQGSAKDELTAQNMLADAHKGKEDPSIASALNNLANQEFVIAKRDPALWKYSVQAFRPKIVEGKAIRIHPLVTGGFNADFDGDTMSIQVPFTDAAKRDAARMLPSKNIFSESTGGVAYLPSMESLLGLHRLSLVGQAKGASFSTDKDVVAALHAKKVDLNEQVKLGGKLTTPGRVLLASAVPDNLKEKMLTDFSLELNKKGVNTVYTSIGKDHAPRFAHFADKLKDLGYDTSTGIINTPLAAQGKVSVGAHSFKLTDFLADSATRDPILHKADAEVDAIRQKPGLRPEERKRQIAETYLRADAEMQAQHKAQGKMQTNALGKMSRAGMKPGMDQYKQMIIAPMVMANSKGELIPVPVRKSYGEGVDQMGYTVQQEGARSGTIKKVQEVQEPGYMTKLLQNTSMHTLIDSHDCGTTKGRLVGIGDYDIVDRHLAAPLKTHGLDLPGGTLLTKDVVDRIRKVDPNAKLSVRSPIHCHSEKGVCQKCYGLDANGKHLDIGSNVGVLSAHTLGERAVQLTLKAFHCLHEHSLVLVRHKGRVYHTTLRAVFEGSPGTDPEVRHPQDLDVWGPEGWVRVLGASRHLQEPGTQMVFARTRSGFGLLSQDNHPHMLAENLAVCERCGTYPKRSNGGKQHYCRRCGRTWQGELPEPEDFQMVMPSELSEKSHTAKVSWGPSPTEQEPPLRSGWLAGMFCAEGYVHAQNQEQGSYVIGFGISQNQGTPVYTKLGSCLAQEFPEARLGARPRAFQVYGRERGLFFEKTFGRYSRNKGLPEGWSGLPVAWLADFVSGVFDGDGTLVSTKDSAWKVGRIDTTSYLLAQQLHHILRSRGIHSRVLLSPWRKASLHQGFAVTFPITAEAKKLLSASLKLADVAARPHGNEERFGEVVDYVRPVRFGAPPWVYDLETETSTLCVNNVWTHNSGGVATAGGGALGAFGRLEQLTYLPDHIPNAAVHATVHGKIEKIEPTATGTNIYIHGKAHFVGKDSKGNPLNEKQEGVFHKKAWTAPHVGMEVNPGDFLSDPNRTNLNPHRYFEATKSMDKVQEKLADEMHGLYADEGVRKRAVEVVVRSMGNLTQIEHPGEGTDFLRGQTYSRSAVETLNKELKAHGKGLITHKPVLRGVNLLPLDMTTDWMARLNHQKLRGTMMEGAAQGWASDIHGRHPVPGLMYGAEFGRQSTDPRKGGKTNFY